MSRRISRYKAWLWAGGVLVAVIALPAVYLLATSPYARDTIVRPAYSTSYANGRVSLTTNYTPRFYSGWLVSAIGYYRGAVAFVWDRLESPKLPAGNAASIIAGLHALRFDPSKPYLISGDQFDGLYPRNLSVFYQDMLNPATALSPADWHNRQRIAVQSLAYCLAALQQLRHPVTTLMPISPHGVMALNIFAYPSDTMFSVFQLLAKLEADPATHPVALQLQRRYNSGLAASYQNYLATVRDPQTGLIKTKLQLSSARDAAQRQSSFYDNVILWKTEQLATQLGYDRVPTAKLASLRQTIISRYWDGEQGHFIDDVAAGHQHSYSSDWLIALPLGFLDPASPADLAKLERISTYIDQQRLTSPLPIRYTTDPDSHENFFIKTFADSYGSTDIWSYWGNQYITLETDLYAQTHQPIYARHVTTALAAWQAVIVRDRGYPETLNTKGQMFETPFYESIRRNGWVVGFEVVKLNWSHVAPK